MVQSWKKSVCFFHKSYLVHILNMFIFYKQFTKLTFSMHLSSIHIFSSCNMENISCIAVCLEAFISLLVTSQCNVSEHAVSISFWLIRYYPSTILYLSLGNYDHLYSILQSPILCTVITAQCYSLVKWKHWIQRLGLQHWKLKNW